MQCLLKPVDGYMEIHYTALFKIIYPRYKSNKNISKNYLYIETYKSMFKK